MTEADEIFAVIPPRPSREWPEIPLIFTVPHSGRLYPPELLAATTADLAELRQSEDALVDQLFANAANYGATQLVMRLARIFVDVNRDEQTLDPHVIAGTLPATAQPHSPQVKAGIGIISRLTAQGNPIYAQKIPLAAAKARIDRYYRPFHAELAARIAASQQKFGQCLVIDCHSMPSPANGSDVVLGDHYGRACEPALTAQCETIFTGFGYKVRRNDPYAGGYITRHYGKPSEHVQVLQIEFSRRLYLDAASLQPSPHFPILKSQIHEFIQALSLKLQKDIAS